MSALSRFLAKLASGWSAALQRQPVTPHAPETAKEAAPIAAPSSVPPAAIQIVAEFEGFRADAYLCPAGVWTVGYGTTRMDGRAVQAGDRVDEATARKLLRADLEDAARAVDRLVVVDLTEHQRAALISWIYNVGQGAAERSTLLRLLNLGNYADVPDQLRRWNKAGGRVLAGLERRREAEARLWSGRA